jgi:hypothetical protein
MTYKPPHVLVTLATIVWVSLPASSLVQEPSRQTQRVVPVAARPTPGSFRFTARDAAGQPVRWPSCRRIELVVNPAGAPAGGIENLRAAVRAVAAASGLRVTLVGTTRVRPDPRGWPGHLRPEPTGWPPVLVAWAVPGTSELADDGSSATTTPVSVETTPGHPVMVAGQVVVNLRQNYLYEGGAAGLGTALFLHELGHVLGLDHVADQREVMNPVVGAVHTLGPGDLRGLHLAGQAGCPIVPPP